MKNIQKLVRAVLLLLTFTTGVFATETVIDHFDTQSYGNNDGTQNFTSDWFETGFTGGGDGPTVGTIRIETQALTFEALNQDEQIFRGFDASNASAMRIILEIDTSSLAAGDKLLFRINSTAGNETIAEFNNTSSGTLIYTFTDPKYMVPGALIRFEDNGVDWNPSSKLLISNIRIELIPDTDGDGVADNIDIDDDNDGILDTVEGGHCTGFADSHSHSSVATPDNALGAPDSAYARITNNDVFVLDLTDTVLAGNNIDITFKPQNGQTDFTIEASADGVNFTEIGHIQNAGNQEQTVSYTSPAGGARYVKFVHGNTVLDVDAISYSCALAPELDTDRDGLINRLDLDSDDDSIPDTVEAQSTLGYIFTQVNPGVRTDGTNDRLPQNGLTPPDTDNDGIPDYLDLDSDGDRMTDCKEGMPDAFTDKKCPVESGDPKLAGIVKWMLNLTNVPYADISGKISPTVTGTMFDFDTTTPDEVSYREASICGNLTWELKKDQWKTITASCSLVNTNIGDVFAPSSGPTLGTICASEDPNEVCDWVMYKQHAYSGKNTDVTLMQATETMTSIYGYWIISMKDANVTLIDSAHNTVEARKDDITNHVPNSNASVINVFRTNTVPAGTAVTKYIFGSPYSGDMALSDLYITPDNKVNYYAFGDSNLDNAVYPILYVYDHIGVDTQNYVAKTAGTPGFGGLIKQGNGFWFLVKANSGANVGLDYPYYKSID